MVIFRRVALLIVLASGLLARAADPAPAESLKQRARAALARGDKEQALKLAEQLVAASPNDANAFYVRAAVRDARREREAAIDDYGKCIDLAPTQPDGYQRRGEDHFRLGHFRESVADFDKVIALVPAREPYHWQRGISLYYAGEFERGAKQFELHRTVNPQDVENAAWHFLCVARQSGIEKARAGLIPIRQDERVPMMQIYDLFAGKGTEKEVLTAVEAGQPGKDDLAIRRFYADLYLGLYEQVAGKKDSAAEHLRQAAAQAPDDYMGDVARVEAILAKRDSQKQ